MRMLEEERRKQEENDAAQLQLPAAGMGVKGGADDADKSSKGTE